MATRQLSSGNETTRQVSFHLPTKKKRYHLKVVTFRHQDESISSPVLLLEDDNERRTVITLAPVETAVSTAGNNRRSYEYGMGYHPPSYHSGPGFHAVDFSPLFIALIPIALFLGAAAAFALSVATSSSSASASAQQQQQQEESSNNNNAANSNNNNALLAALLASNTNNNNQPIIIINNATGQIIPYYFGRAMDGKFHFSWPRRRPRRFRRTHLNRPKGRP